MRILLEKPIRNRIDLGFNAPDILSQMAVLKS